MGTITKMSRRVPRVHGATRGRVRWSRRSLAGAAVWQATKPPPRSRVRPIRPAATVSDLLRPTDRYRSPLLWDLGLPNLANAIRAGSVFEGGSATPAPGTGIGARSQPRPSRVPISVANLDEAKSEPRVSNRLIDISLVEALGAR